MTPLGPGEAINGGDLADADPLTLAHAAGGAYVRWMERRKPFHEGKQAIGLFAITRGELDKLSTLIRDRSDDADLGALNRELVDVLLAMEKLSDGG